MAPQIAVQLGQHNAYVEPMCGSMAVLSAKKPCSSEIVNDLHGDLVNLAWTIQHNHEGPRLYRRLRRLWTAADIFAEADGKIHTYPLASSIDGVTARTAERAYWWFVLSWMGRNGFLGTTRDTRSFAVRYTASGGNQAVRFASAVDSIPAWRRRLRTVTVLRMDAFALLNKLKDVAGQAIYVDPPYMVKSASYKHDFRDEDHGRLAECLGRFRRTRVVVSYYHHPTLEVIYRGWTKIDCTRAKHLSVQGRNGSASTTAPEVLFVNGRIY